MSFSLRPVGRVAAAGIQLSLEKRKSYVAVRTPMPPSVQHVIANVLPDIAAAAKSA